MALTNSHILEDILESAEHLTHSRRSEGKSNAWAVMLDTFGRWAEFDSALLYSRHIGTPPIAVFRDPDFPKADAEVRVEKLQPSSPMHPDPRSKQPIDTYRVVFNRKTVGGPLSDRRTAIAKARAMHNRACAENVSARTKLHGRPEFGSF